MRVDSAVYRPRMFGWLTEREPALYEILAGYYRFVPPAAG